MVLIIALATDQSINKLIDWLNYYNLSFFRFNDEDEIEDLTIAINNTVLNFEIHVKNRGIIFSDQIKAVYYRGGRFLPAKKFIEKLEKSQRKYLKGEWSIINSFFMHYFESIPSLGGFSKETENNKIMNLLRACKIGLKIPETIISSNFNHKMFKTKREIITKVLKTEIKYEDNGYLYYGDGSIKITKDDIQKYPNIFFPAQFQNNITKKFEIRTFYLNGKTFSMAIIPKNNNIKSDENVDYRVYSQTNYMEKYINIPFLLPKSISDKIDILMKSLDLKIGSIDFIVNEKYEYIFLEINPVGQYDWVSKCCNYNLDKQIVLHVLKLLKTNKYATN